MNSFTYKNVGNTVAAGSLTGFLTMAMAASHAFAVLVVEFDAASGVSDTGGLVDSWDATGSGTVVPQATPDGGSAARRPTLGSSVFASGQPGIQFDANPTLADRDVMTFSDAGLPAGSADFTIVTVFRLINLETPPNTRPTWFSYGSSVGNFHLAALAVDRPVGGNDLLLRENGTDIQSDLALNTGENYAAIVTRSGVDITFDVLSESGTVSATGTDGVSGGPIVINLSGGVFGNMVTPAHGDFQEAGLDGYIGLVQVYDTALDSSERTVLLGRLDSYVTPLSAFPFSFSPAPGAFTLSFLTLADKLYMVETVEDLISGTWVAKPYTLTGTGGTLWITEPAAGSDLLNYRVVLTQ
jgi:hypothetical protein